MKTINCFPLRNSASSAVKDFEFVSYMKGEKI